MKVGRELERFIHHLKKQRGKIIDDYKEMTNEIVNIIILRILFLSILSYFGILTKSVQNNQKEEYQNQVHNHNLLLWTQSNSTIDQLDTKSVKQLEKTIFEFTLKFTRDSVTTLLGIVYEALHSDDSRKRKGMFFTPPALAHVIFPTAFSQLFPKRNICKMETSVFLDSKIADNACGSGVFLISAIEHISDTFRQIPDLFDSDASMLNFILSNMIHGVDSDSTAIAVTEAQLWLQLAATYGDIETWRWKKRNLQTSDSLIDTTLESDSFDLIIGNPPYMRLSALNPEYQQMLRERFDATREYNLHALFVKKSLELLRDGGVLGYLLHKNLFTLDTYRTLRQELINNHACLNLVDCGHFKGVTAETAFIVLRKGKRKSRSTLSLASYNSKTKNVLEGLCIDQQEYAELVSHWNHRFVINLSNHGKNLLSHLRDLDWLGNHVSISRGIETGSNVEYVSSKPTSQGNWIPLLRGRDISPYHGNHQTFINYNRNRLSKPGRVDLLSLPKVILQQNASRPIAYFDDGKHLVLNSTTYLADASPEILKSLCVFLNSQIMNWFFNTVITNNASLTVNILPNNLSILPIPNSFDVNLFAHLCSLLHSMRLDRKLSAEFNVWNDMIAEAAVCEAYLPHIFKEKQIHELLQGMDFEEVSASEFKFLLSNAEDILENEFLNPLRELS